MKMMLKDGVEVEEEEDEEEFGKQRAKISLVIALAGFGCVIT